MPEGSDAKLFQVLRRQARENPFVYLVFAECGFIAFEAKAPQPPSEVHDGALGLRRAYHCRSGLERSRGPLGFGEGECANCGPVKAKLGSLKPD